MSTGEKKPAAPPTTAPPPLQQAAKPQEPVKKPVISRRTFLKAAVGASIVLAGASMASSGQILSPLIPTAKGPTIIANAVKLESDYDAIRGKSQEIVSEFFYWPYDASVSPYYKNVLVRLPDEILDPAVRGSTPNLAHYAAWNTTCVHLRCLVNPGYADGQYRLRCPCHGSQYLLSTAVPVKGPAFDLGLRPLPRIVLSLDSSNNIVAQSLDGEPGIGRSD